MFRYLSLLLFIGLVFWVCEDSINDEKSFIEFTNLFGGGGDDGGFSVEQTTDGGHTSNVIH
tara:strand:- start:440 stop:622 length:183 start_codon:yes stop_codon:yes gene_type:complete